MPRARIPEEAKVLVELGTSRGNEVKYDPEPSFSICWVITDGTKRWKYLWIARRPSGVYVSFAIDGGLHESYHEDGNHWWKAGEDRIDLPRGAPLSDLKGAFALRTSSSDISSAALSRGGYPEFSGEQTDRLIYIDNRVLPDWIHTHIWLVEPFRHAEIPLIVDYPVDYHLVTHTLPWIAVLIYEDPKQTRRPGRPRQPGA